MKKHILILAVTLIALALVGCGDDASQSGPPAEPEWFKGRGEESEPIATRRNTKSGPIVHVTSEQWERIKSHFEKFSSSTAIEKKDPFRDHRTRYMVKPEVQLVVEDETMEAEPTYETSPLLRYEVGEFELVLIMSGTILPKAVLLDPIGNTWVVMKDTPLGNKNGIVQAITQYSVIVSEPGAEEPIVKTIKPTIFSAAQDLSRVDTGDASGERLTGPPLN